MPETYQPFITGPDISAVAIFPVSAINPTTKAVTYATSQSYLSNWKEAGFRPRPRLVSITPASQRGTNNQIVEDDFDFVLAGYVTDQTGVTGAIPAPLISACYQYDRFKIVVTRAGETRTYFVIRGEGDNPYRREGEEEMITFKRWGVTGVANPTITSVL